MRKKAYIYLSTFNCGLTKVARVLFGIKIKKQIKEDFQKAVKESGLSTCFVVETLLSAWLAAQEIARAPKVNHEGPIVINQQIDYNVARARRVKRRGDMVGSKAFGFRKDQWYDVDVGGVVSETNFYDPAIGWIHKPDEDLNSHGHAFGCLCSVCG